MTGSLFRSGGSRSPEEQQARTYLRVTVVVTAANGQRPVLRRTGQQMHVSRAASTLAGGAMIERSGDMNVEMSVYPASDLARLYDGHRHPFRFKWSRGGTHVPGRRP
jgi:hypothetical protein